MTQWLIPVNNRRWLKQKVTALGGDLMQQRLDSLDTGCDKFAKWRWKTLGNVTRDMLRLRGAFRRGIASVGSAKAIGGRSKGTSQQLWDLAHDDTFWFETTSLHQLVQPLTALASWVRGCDCHDQDRIAGKAVTCCWQGCRAATLASRVKQAVTELEAARSAFLQGGQEPEALALTSMLATMEQKFAFLHHEPYTIWQAMYRHVAADILARRDSMVSRGRNLIA